MSLNTEIADAVTEVAPATEQEFGTSAPTERVWSIGRYVAAGIAASTVATIGAIVAVNLLAARRRPQRGRFVLPLVRRPRTMRRRPFARARHPRA